MRVCTKYKESKELSYFSLHKRHSTGYSPWCKSCHSKYCKAYYYKNREAMLKRSRIFNLNLRLEVIFHYSAGTSKCSCCGENKLEFLSIDHISGGGTSHRESVGYGSRFYLWLRKNKYPEGYRVLCHNCNMSLGQYGYCPHGKEINGKGTNS